MNTSDKVDCIVWPTYVFGFMPETNNRQGCIQRWEQYNFDCTKIFKYMYILTLFQPCGANSAHHGWVCTNSFPVDTSLIGSYGLIIITFSGVKGQWISAFSLGLSIRPFMVVKVNVFGLGKKLTTKHQNQPKQN